MIESLSALKLYIVIPVILLLVAWVFLSIKKKKRLIVNSELNEDDSNKPDTSKPDLPATSHMGMIWHPGEIKFKKIKEAIGHTITLDPTMPASGEYSLCMLGDKDETIAFEPLGRPLSDDDSPTIFYEAVECPEVGEVYVNFSSLWEKFKALVPYLIAGAEALILLVIVDKLGGGG